MNMLMLMLLFYRIECIRRDQCPITMKIQEACLRLLFRSRDLSLVKSYLCEQWSKILQGGDKLAIQDFIFRKEVKYGKYNPSYLPPGAVLVNKRLVHDEMAIPPFRWKVPYVVIAGLPKSLLSDLIISPEELLMRGNSYRINANYYIEKCINPALVRLLSLCGADIASWYRQLAKPKLRRRLIVYDTSTSENKLSTSIIQVPQPKLKQSSMDAFTIQTDCLICSSTNALPKKAICKSCYENPAESLMRLYHRLNIAVDADRAYQYLCSICSRSTRTSHAGLFQAGEMVSSDSCQSIDCQVFFDRCRIITRIEDYQNILTDFDN
jgi:DNA polymerase zeta